MAELIFHYGTMNCGKSTLALQTHHNQAMSGKVGKLFSVHDRAGAFISSRIGLQQAAVVVSAEMDLRHEVDRHLDDVGRLDYLICDEACFYAPNQIDQLASVVDDLRINVYAYGLLRAFTGDLLDGAKRLMEVADRCVEIQVQALCWCGSRATHNARLVDGVMVRDGETVVVGDLASDDADQQPPVTYEVLCRRHFVAGATSRDLVIVVDEALARSSAGAR